MLGPRASAIEFIRGDVLRTGPPEVVPAHVLAVLNFSIYFQRNPEQLDAYLRHAAESLAPNGILVLNLFGGKAVLEPGTTRHQVTPKPRLPGETAIPDFTYLWEVRSYDPASQRLDCRIHFEVPDAVAPGRTHAVRDAFTYDWRYWSVAEIVGACNRAGFSEVQVWRHTYDPAKGAAGVFLGAVQPGSFLGLDHWTAYVVAGR
jgi:hypothetical protein